MTVGKGTEGFRAVCRGALAIPLVLAACVAGEETRIEGQTAVSFVEELRREGWKVAQGRDGEFRVAWRSLAAGNEVPRNKEFDMELYVLAGDAPLAGAQVRVRGWMPDHGHGLARRPPVSEPEPGRYRVEGMLLHMRGHWQVFFDIAYEGVGDIVEFEERL